MREPSILISGATGLLGRACLGELRGRYGAEKMAALVRRGRDVAELDALDVRTIEVDLGAADLGISGELYEALGRSAHSIIHCAADIRFQTSLEESRQANLLGTKNLLRFAQRCSQLERFAHMSTVYVWGGRSGRIPEGPAQPGPFFNPYQQTKFEAEEAVLASMNTVPASIYRFSTMIYDGAQQRVAQFNYFHQLLRLALVNPLRTIPALRDAKVDLILSDWAARVFAFLFEERWNRGEIVHVCAGPERSLTVGELLDRTFDVFREAGTRPEIVSLEEFDRKAHAILTTPSRRQMWHSLSQFLPHMNVDQRFDCGKLSDAAPLPDIRQVFREVLRYCVASGWGRNNYCSWPAQLDPAPAVQPKQ